MKLPINTLSRAERERLAAGTLSDDAVEALFHVIERNHRAKVRAYRRVSIFVVAISVVLLAMTVSLTGPTPAALAACIAVSLLDIVVLICAWYLGIGIFRHQFNAALVEGHPEFASRHQL